MKVFFYLVVAVIFGGVLAGCGVVGNSDQSSVKLNSQLNSAANSQVKGIQESGNAGTVQGASTPQPTPSSLSGMDAPRKAGMKTIEDFSPIEGTQVTLKTNKGDIVLELFRDKAPLTTLNFLTLVKEGFYDGIVFHRVIPGFMAQFGDPLSKDPEKQALWGTGGPGYAIADEFSPELRHDDAGILSMANSGPNTGGSQVFITYAPQPHLDGKHAVFGKVVSGMDVLTQITNGDKIISATYQ